MNSSIIYQYLICINLWCILFPLSSGKYFKQYHTVSAEATESNIRYNSFEIDGITRTFQYYVPSQVKEKPNLVFVLHGSNGTGEIIMNITDGWFNKLSEDHKNAIIVYPDGYMRHWNECRKEANFDAKLLNIDDISFFEEMVSYFIQKYSINRDQVFVTGHSNGGHMVFKLAKERPDIFKAFAAVSASLPVENNDDCEASNNPVSIMVLNGTGDNVNPYFGGEVNIGQGNKRGAVLPTHETMEYWANLTGLPFPSSPDFHFPDIDREDGTTVSRYKVSSHSHEIILIRVENGGHIFSVPKEAESPAFLGKKTNDINMAEIIYDFFISN